MRLLRIGAVAMACASVPKPATAQPRRAAPPLSASLLVARLVSVYRSARLYESDFSEMHWTSGTDREATFRGHVTCKRLPLAFGDWNCVGRPRSAAALAFLNDLTGQYAVRAFPVPAHQDEYVVEAIPRRSQPDVAKVLLFVRGSTAHVLRLLIIDWQGTRARVGFRNEHTDH